MPRKKKHATPPPAGAAPDADSRAGDVAVRKVRPSFPVVGIGASAGGLEAFKKLLHALPADTGMAFVLVQHLSPTHDSKLSEILTRATPMPVMEVRDEPRVRPNHVYVIPPGYNMIIERSALKLLPREQEQGQLRSIDFFLRSLAEDQDHRAIGVILSGTASDGTLGLQEIKGKGGITFAQDDTAQHNDMPRSAIAAGCVDFVLPPHQIAAELARIAAHPYVAPASTPVTETAAENGLDPAAADPPHAPSKSDDARARADLRGILQILNRATDVDFTDYKSATLYRRITRRMLLQKMKGLKDYEQFLKDNADEVQALYQDVLINVTSFFRDPKMFEALKQKVFPALFKDRSRQDPLRIWVLGCSTGEEAYSLAMAATEFSESIGAEAPLQVFATDLNAANIDKARGGSYAKSVTQDMSPQRLRRFFSEVDGGYRISKALRDICVFARHNVLVEPPFSRIDLISCRNLLIYLDPALQQRVVPLFHYALKPSGFLVLGNSETIGGYRDLFHMEDMKEKIFSRKPGPGRGHAAFLPRLHRQEEAQGKPAGHAGALAAPGSPQSLLLREAFGGPDVSREVDRTLLARYAPPGVLVNPDLEILQFRGETGAYLAPAPGNASLSLLKMAREGLLGPLRALLNRARKEQVPVREENVRIRLNGGHRAVNLEAVPVKGRPGHKGPDAFLVLFEDAQSGQTGDGEGKSRAKAGSRTVAAAPKNARPARQQITELNQELAATREYLQAVVEEQEAANEELQSAHEEAQSANEELQSVNEELETSKEEIQSSNEELQTVNDELSHRNEQAARLNNDLTNLIASVQTAIVIVGRDLRIRRFSPMAEKTLTLIPADVGRPIGDLKIDLPAADVETLLKEVIDTVRPQEREVQDRSGHWYSLRIRPYVTLDNKIDGAVLMLVDVDALKRGREFAENIVATVHEPLLVLDETLRVQSASRSFYEAFQVSPERTVNRPIYELGNRQWDIVKLRHLLEEVLPLDSHFENYEVEHDYESIGRKVMRLNARRLIRTAGEPPLILLAIEDVTERKRAEEASARLAAIVSSSDDAIISKDLRGIIQTWNQGAQRLFGYTAEEAIGQPATLLIPAERADEEPGILERIGRGETIDHYETVRQRKDGSLLDISLTVSPILNAAGQVTGAAKIARDITGRKQAEEAAVRLAAIVASSDDAIISKNLRGIIQTWNQGAQRLFGYTAEEAIGQPATLLIPAERLDEEPEILERIGRGETIDHYETVRQRKDGNLLDISLTVSPLRDSAGCIIGAAKIARDITERRRAEAALRKYAADLSEADRRKNEFLGMLAHELRNPLAPLSNALGIAKNAGSDLKAIPELLPIMERQVHAMSRLIDDLLDVSRITHGKVRLQRQAVELAAVLNHCVEMTRHQADARRQTLATSLPKEPVHLSADPTRLEQVFCNLLNNASKYGSPGGHIWLSAELAEPATPQSAREVVVRVRDDGSGIAPDLLPRVFDLFTQGERSLDRSQGGLGIGLALVRSLVELHGGRVQVDSPAPGLGRGSEFRVVLPVAEAPATGKEAASDVEQAAPL